MKVKDFLGSFADLSRLHDRYIELYPLLADYEMEKLSEAQLMQGKIRHYDAFCALMNRIKKMNTVETDDVLFVTKEIGTFFDDEEYGLNSWVCKREDILEKAKGEITLWNGENRIEHYAYDMDSLGNIISCELFIHEVDGMDAACEILENITFFGFEEDSRMEKVGGIIESLKEQTEELKAGTLKTVPAEEVFEELRKEILSNATEEEKEEILREEEEHEKNKNRDDAFMRVSMNINHIQSIQAVLSYYRQEIKSCNVKL